MDNTVKRGTFIHGIAASQSLDSSGERIDIAGVDISSLTKDAIFNYEHDSKSPSSIVGKIWEAKKIIKRSDCENDHHRYFWDDVKTPYIYVAGELFDGVGHKEAAEIAAMVRFDKQESLNKDAKRLINFSIEGSRVEKTGSTITKCIARKVSITITPCNKTCIAEELKMDITGEKKADSGEFSFIQDIMGKTEEPSCQLMKGEIPFLYKNEEVKIPAKEAVKEHKRLVAVLQSPSHKDDKKEAKKQRKELKEYKEKLNKVKKNKLGKYDSNVRKALTASCGMGAPSAKVQDVAKSEFLYKNDIPAQKPPSQGSKIGQTKSGKAIFSHAKIADYQGFSSADHAEAADFHRQMVNKSPSYKDKEMHLNKMRLHNAAFSTNVNKEIARPAAVNNPVQKPQMVNAPVAPIPQPNAQSQGVMGYSAAASAYGGLPAKPAAMPAPAAPIAPPVAKMPMNAMNPNMKIAKSETFLIRKLGESDVNKGSKNVREQRKKVFGTRSQPGANTAMREKHINHIKAFVDKFLGLDLHPSGGKINEKTGERREADAEVGVDKPDWRSGRLEAQWNPEAIVHEIAHLMIMPKGVGLEEGQRLMDKQYGDVQKQYGYMQQKRSQGEVQPMAAEQLIRRALGLPASQVSIPVKSKDDPHRVSVEDPTQRIATRIKQGTDKQGNDKYVDLIRQARNLHPEHKQRLADIFSGKLKFHPDKGWLPNKGSLDAAITNRQPNAVLARQNKKQMAAPQPAELPPNVVRMKQPALAAPAPAPVDPEINQAGTPPMKIAKSEQRKIMKMLGDEAFEHFEKKEELLAFLAEKLPNLSEKERKAIAKAVALTSEKKKELALKSLMDEE